MTGTDFQIVTDRRAPTLEDHKWARQLVAPKWCQRCDVGQSVDRCWLCAGPTVETARRAMHNPHNWNPEGKAA